MTFLSAASQPNDAAELRELFVAIRDETASDNQFRELERRLLQDTQAMDYYVQFMQLHVLLEEKLSSTHRDLIQFSDFDAPIMHPAIFGSPLPNLLSAACHGTVNFFSEDVPFACLMATLIVGFALVIASFITKEHYTQLPWRPVASAERSYTAPESDGAGKARAAAKEQEEVLHFVGRITGMVDCRWASPGRTFSSSTDYLVALNDKYSLISGLMEITYDTGAKVILQGPCAYAVDSAAGGYLSLGKLTARVENKGAGDGGRGTGEDAVASGQWPVASENAESRNPKIPKSQNPSSLPTTHYPLPTNSNPPPPAPRPQSPAPLFAVRTPTAVVTDLGTEFGVEVDAEGVADVHVFEGAVNAVYTSSRGGNPTEARLAAGEGLRLSRGAAPVRIVVRRESFLGPGEVFERRRKFAGDRNDQPAPPQGLVAHWKFDEGSGDRVKESVLGTAAKVKGPAAWVPGTCGSALQFGGLDNPTWIDTGYDLVGRDPEFRKHFTISVWVRLPNEATDSPLGSIVEQQYFLFPNDFGIHAGFYAAVSHKRSHVGVHAAGQWQFMNLEGGVPLDAWSHIVFVFDGNGQTRNLRAYFDGKFNATFRDTGNAKLDNSIKSARLCIGRHPFDPFPFIGAMDDLALWNRALGDAEIRLLSRLAQEAELNFDAQKTDQMFALFADGPGSRGIIAGRNWSRVSGLAGHATGDVWQKQGKYCIQFDDAGNGLTELDLEGSAVPTEKKGGERAD